jgi:hypothetical protein
MHAKRDGDFVADSQADSFSAPASDGVSVHPETKTNLFIRQPTKHVEQWSGREIDMRSAP